jgi:hypothetical protein
VREHKTRRPIRQRVTYQCCVRGTTLCAPAPGQSRAV